MRREYHVSDGVPAAVTLICHSEGLTVAMEKHGILAFRRCGQR